MKPLCQKKIRQLLSDEAGGAELIEASVAVPVFAIMLVGIFGWSYFMFQLNIVQYATKQAARCAIMPKVNGTSLPWCGWQPLQTYQTYGVANTFGLITDQSAFVQGQETTATSGTVSYKYSCIGSTANNPLGFILSQYIPAATKSSACRPIQAQ